MGALLYIDLSNATLDLTFSSSLQLPFPLFESGRRPAGTRCRRERSEEGVAVEVMVQEVARRSFVCVE
jgi:hypothetical protein